MPRTIRPQQCTVCRLPAADRARLELYRVGGASIDAVAKQFSVSRDSVWRHMGRHVTDRRRAELLAGPAQVEQLAAAAADESRSVLDQFKITKNILFNSLIACAESGDRNGVAAVSGRLIEALRELGKLSGELRELSGLTVRNTQINIFADPKFVSLQTGLLDLARTHPGARSDIVALLRRLDDEQVVPELTGRPMIECEAVDAA